MLGSPDETEEVGFAPYGAGFRKSHWIGARHTGNEVVGGDEARAALIVQRCLAWINSPGQDREQSTMQRISSGHTSRATTRLQPASSRLAYTFTSLSMARDQIIISRVNDIWDISRFATIQFNFSLLIRVSQNSCWLLPNVFVGTQ